MPAEIGPGFLVEALKDGTRSGVVLGKRYWVTEVIPSPTGRCDFDHGPCFGINLQGIYDPSEIFSQYPSRLGWAACCFKPVGGDREVEIGLFATQKRKLSPQEIIQYTHNQMAVNPVLYPTPEELRRILGF